MRRLLWQLEWKRHVSFHLRQLQGEYFAARGEIASLKRRVALLLNTTMPDFVDATWTASPHFLQGHNGLAPRYIILHTTATDKGKEEVALDHEKEGESVHYIIDQDGAILQTVSELDSAVGTVDLTSHAAHFWNGANINGNINYVSFVIEMLTGEDKQVSQAALVTAFVMIKDICQRHRILKNEASEAGGICGHYQANPKFASDCGRNFPYSALIDYLDGVAPVPVLEEPVKVEEPVKKSTKRVKADE